MIQVCWIKWHSQVSSLRSKFCRRVLRCSHPNQTLSKGHFLLTRSWTFDKFSQQDSLNLQPCLQDWFEKGGVRGFQLYTYPLRWVGQWVNATSEFWQTGWLLNPLIEHMTHPITEPKTKPIINLITNPATDPVRNTKTNLMTDPMIGCMIKTLTVTYTMIIDQWSWKG